MAKGSDHREGRRRGGHRSRTGSPPLQGQERPLRDTAPRARRRVSTADRRLGQRRPAPRLRRRRSRARRAERHRRRPRMGGHLRGGVERPGPVWQAAESPRRGGHERRATVRGELSTGDASAVVAFVVGSLVFGAFAPRKAAGFAAPTLKRVLAGCRASSSRRPSARK